MISRIFSIVFAALLLAGSATTAIAPTDAVPQATPAITQTITLEEAETIALTHAGLTRQQVTHLRTEIDDVRGQAVYDVEFQAGDWEYDYTVFLADGRIHTWEKDYDPVEPVPTPPPETLPPETLTREEAIAIALTHAGFDKAQVSRLQAEKDYDDGIWEYDVEFYVGNWEYEYEIHGKTGKILSFDKELDD